jgi:hypothetical protein
MCLQFGFVIFWQKDFGAKAFHKMLVKLMLILNDFVLNILLCLSVRLVIILYIAFCDNIKRSCKRTLNGAFVSGSGGSQLFDRTARFLVAAKSRDQSYKPFLQCKLHLNEIG